VARAAATISVASGVWNLSSGYNAESMEIATAVSGRGMEIGRDAGGANWMVLNPDTTNDTGGAIVPVDDGTTALGDSTRRFGAANVKGVNNTGTLVEKNYTELDAVGTVSASATYNDFLIKMTSGSSGTIDLTNLEIDGNVVQFVDIGGIFDTKSVTLQASSGKTFAETGTASYVMNSQFSVVRIKFYGGTFNKWMVI
jgi:hypothetical protein